MKRKVWVISAAALVSAVLVLFLLYLVRIPRPDHFIKWAHSVTEDKLANGIESGVWLSYTDLNTTPQTHSADILTPQERNQLVEWLHAIDKEQNVIYERDYQYSDSNILCYLWIDEEACLCILYYEPNYPDCLRIYMEWQDMEKRETDGNMNPKKGEFLLTNSPLVEFVRNYYR